LTRVSAAPPIHTLQTVRPTTQLATTAVQLMQDRHGGEPFFRGLKKLRLHFRDDGLLYHLEPGKAFAREFKRGVDVTIDLERRTTTLSPMLRTGLRGVLDEARDELRLERLDATTGAWEAQERRAHPREIARSHLLPDQLDYAYVSLMAIKYDTLLPFLPALYDATATARRTSDGGYKLDLAFPPSAHVHSSRTTLYLRADGTILRGVHHAEAMGRLFALGPTEIAPEKVVRFGQLSAGTRFRIRPFNRRLPAVANTYVDTLSYE
jgi:hypothetical protein